MAKKHLKTSDGKSAVCGVQVDPSRLVDNAADATCNGCLQSTKPKLLKNKKSDTAPDWSRKCTVCGQAPVFPFTGMCGPCIFGEADTAFGDW